MKEKDNKKLLVFLTIDAWAVSHNIENNAIRKAHIPGFKNLIAAYPATVIKMPGLSNSLNYKSIGAGMEILDSNNLSINSISKIISHANLNQLKIANSQDFPLLSVFFNNSSERFLNEDWLIVDNKKNNYLPFLNKNNLLDELIRSIKSKRYNFIFSSFSEISNSVLSGDFLSVVSAVENVSSYLEKIAKIVLDFNGTLIVSSAYGGAEDVYNIGTGIANKKRTNNLVPLLIISHKYHGKSIGLDEAPNNDISLLSSQGSFLDIAPTILNLLNLDIPPEMKGESFI